MLRLNIRSSHELEKKVENGYDSDGEIGPHYDALINQGPDELAEPSFGEGGGNSDAAGLQAEDANNTDNQFIDIPKEVLKKMKVADLRKELKARGYPVDGKKNDLLDRLTTAIEEGAPVLSEECLAQRKEDELTGFPPTAHWVPLDPLTEVVQEPINVSDEMHPPTVPADEVEFLKPKHNFGEKFQREEFAGTEKRPAKYRNGHTKRDNNGNVIYEEVTFTKGGPRRSWIRKNNLTIDSEPQEWFRAFLPSTVTEMKTSGAKVCVEKWAEYTNKRAYFMSAGQKGGIYPTWTPFSTREIEQHIAIYFLQGLNPSPQINMKFNSQQQDPVQGNDLVHRVIGPGGVLRHKQFKCFFTTQDPTKPVPPRDTRPNHKVDAFLRHLQETSMSAWQLGRDVSGDEQTIGFKGKHTNDLYNAAVHS